RRRVRPDEVRRTWSAGHALIVFALTLAVSLLLNAPGAHKHAVNQPQGWERDLAVSVTEPLASLSHTLFLDRPRQAVQALADRSGTDAIHTEIAVPPKPVTK